MRHACDLKVAVRVREGRLAAKLAIDGAHHFLVILTRTQRAYDEIRETLGS